MNGPCITPARRIVKRTVGSKGQPAITISNIRIPANDGISGVRGVDSKKISAGAAAYAAPSAGIGLVGYKAEQNICARLKTQIAYGATINAFIVHGTDIRYHCTSGRIDLDQVARIIWVTGAVFAIVNACYRIHASTGIDGNTRQPAALIRKIFSPLLITVFVLLPPSPKFLCLKISGSLLSAPDFSALFLISSSMGVRSNSVSAPYAASRTSASLSSG